MNGNLELKLAVDALADAAEAAPEAVADLKALAVQLWANFDEFALDDLERVLRDEWRMRGLPFNDNAGP